MNHPVFLLEHRLSGVFYFTNVPDSVLYSMYTVMADHPPPRKKKHRTRSTDFFLRDKAHTRMGRGGFGVRARDIPDTTAPEPPH